MLKSDLSKRFFSLLSIDIILKIIGFLLIPVYLKLMTTAEFGIFNYAFSLAMGLSFVIGTGQHIVISRFFHNDEYSNKTIKETILFTVLGFIFIYLTLGIGLERQFTNILFKTEITKILYYGVIYLAIVQALNQILMTYLYQSENIKAVKYKSACDIIISHGTALSLLYFYGELKSEIRIYAIALGFTFSILFFLIKKFNFHSFLFKNYSNLLFKRGLRNGIPVAVGSFSNLFISLGDRYNIEKILDNDQLGIYSLGIALCNVLYVFFNSFQGAWWPVIFKEKNLMKSLSRIHKAYFFFLGGGILFYLGLHPSIHIFTKLGVDGRYLQTLDFLWILVLATFFQICSMLIGSLYEIYEKTYLSVIINIVFSGINLALNSYLIKIYGLNGAAYATLLVSAGLLFFNYSIARCLLKYSKLTNYYKSQ